MPPPTTYKMADLRNEKSDAPTDQTERITEFVSMYNIFKYILSLKSLQKWHDFIRMGSFVSDKMTDVIKIGP